jgi:formate dehydrogenase
MYSSATQDCANKFAAARQVYGFPFTQPFPDLDHVGCLIVAGANPVVSKWSFLQVPNPMRRLREIEARGGKIYFLDPRRTESAKVAGEHVFIRPDTDVFFLLSFLHELVKTGGVERERVARFMTGLDELLQLVEPWPAERTEPVTRVPAAKLREMVATYRTTRASALYMSTGVNMGSNGTLCFWLQEAINAVSGNLDRRGGTLVGKGIVDFIKFGKRTGTLLRTDRSRVGDFMAVNDAFPGGTLADEILTPGRGQIRALFVTGGNPLITMANAGRLREALGKLDLLVTLDIFLNETGSLAHYLLPCTSPLERPDLPFIFPLMLGLQSRPYLQATRAVVEPDGEQRDEATIYLDLAAASGVPLFGSRVVHRALDMAKRAHSSRNPGKQPAIPQESILSLVLRTGRQGSFRNLLADRHGRRQPGHRPGTFLGRRVVTNDGKVHLAPPPLVDQTAKLEGDFARELESSGALKLITKRQVTTHNSWTHNLAEFVDGDRGTNHLYIHPADAAERGLADGDVADVASATATVRVPVKLLADLMPGTVALPHGWGHQHAKGLSVASRTRGVNVNLLAADGPDRLERVSGMSQLTGIPVSVKRAAGPQDASSWSGIGAS